MKNNKNSKIHYYLPDTFLLVPPFLRHSSRLYCPTFFLTIVIFFDVQLSWQKSLTPPLISKSLARTWRFFIIYLPIIALSKSISDHRLGFWTADDYSMLFFKHYSSPSPLCYDSMLNISVTLFAMLYYTVLITFHF